jgi:hypothetical protein
LTTTLNRALVGLRPVFGFFVGREVGFTLSSECTTFERTPEGLGHDMSSRMSLETELIDKLFGTLLAVELFMFLSHMFSKSRPFFGFKTTSFPRTFVHFVSFLVRLEPTFDRKTLPTGFAIEWMNPSVGRNVDLEFIFTFEPLLTGLTLVLLDSRGPRFQRSICSMRSLDVFTQV